MSEATAGDWSRKKERGSVFWVQTGFRILNMVGYLPASLLLVPVMFYFFVTGGEGRRASLDYLRRLAAFGRRQGVSGLPRPTLWNSFRHHLSFGYNVLDRMYFWQDRLDRFEFTWHGREHLTAPRTRGALLVGAHIGSFDAARAFSHGRKLVINVVMYRANAAMLNAVLNARGPGADINVIELDHQDFDKVFELQQRIERGEFVAILADRVPPFGKPRLCRLPFLGEPADLPQNTWIIAGLLKCPVLFTAGVRTGRRRYHVFVEPMTDLVHMPRRQREEALQGYVARFARWMETMCFQYPFQWFNFFPYWAPAQDQETRRES